MTQAAAWDDRLDKLSEFELERVSFYTGERYSLVTDAGEYKCGRCNTLLYKSEDKCQPDAPLNEFPSFSQAASPQAVSCQQVWSFGMEKTEILCGSCQLHLGYVFAGSASERHCILSLCLNFVPSDSSVADSIPEFDTDPKLVLDHLSEQDRIAADIIQSGNLVQMQEPAPEQKEQKTSPKKDTKPPKKATPTPAPKAEPTKKSTPAASAPSKAPTRGAPTAAKEERKSLKKEQQQEETTMVSFPRAVVAPIILTVVTSVIVYFAYKSTQKE